MYYEGMCRLSEEAYISSGLGKRAMPPQAARAVLTKAVKTEIVLTQTFERWRDWLVLRDDKAAHPTCGFAHDFSAKPPGERACRCEPRCCEPCDLRRMCVLQTAERRAVTAQGVRVPLLF
jgi:hypothetical protein